MSSTNVHPTSHLAGAGNYGRTCAGTSGLPVRPGA